MLSRAKIRGAMQVLHAAPLKNPNSSAYFKKNASLQVIDSNIADAKRYLRLKNSCLSCLKNQLHYRGLAAKI